MSAPAEDAAGGEPFETMWAGEDGWSDWVHPVPGYRMKCCDCGLVHDMEFATGETISKGGPLNEGEDETGVIVFRARRSEPAPALDTGPSALPRDDQKPTATEAE